MFWDSVTAFTGSYPCRDRPVQAETKTARLFSAAEEETLVHDASTSFWANVSGLNVEAYSLEPAALEMDSEQGLRVSEQFRGVEFSDGWLLLDAWFGVCPVGRT
jgi:hypothetical protein